MNLFTGEPCDLKGTRTVRERGWLKHAGRKTGKVRTDSISHEIWLAFFDMEDQGGLDGHRWAEGATLEADFLKHSDIALVIVVDMVGDADQQLFMERRSHRSTARRLWNVGGELGYGEWFVPEIRYRILDDHVPFARHGVPSVLVIDMDYPYHHTTADTADKMSPLSLERVGRTLEAFLKSSRID